MGANKMGPAHRRKEIPLNTLIWHHSLLPLAATLLSLLGPFSGDFPAPGIQSLPKRAEGRKSPGEVFFPSPSKNLQCQGVVSLPLLKGEESPLPRG